MPADDLFQFKSRDLINLRKFYKRAPKKFAAASGMLLNNFAFGSRLGSIEVIHQGMVVRSAGFVHSRLQVKKSHFREPISSQVAEMGSVSDRSGRFTGWREQELGQRKSRKKFATLRARKNIKQRIVQRKFRLDAPFITPSRYPKRRGFKGKNIDQRIMIMLKTLDRMNYPAPFKILGHSRIPSGLYIFGGGRTQHDQRELEAVQLFGRPKRTKRVRWLSGGTKRYFGRINLRREWARVIDRVLKRAR
jgi:hypothetical protein